MKKLFSIMLVLLSMTLLCAEPASFKFKDVAEENLMIETNSSQKTLDKGIKISGDSIMAYTAVPNGNHANFMSVVFIEPLKIENVSNIKEAKITGKSLGYDAAITLHFVNSKGKYVKVHFTDAVPKLSGEYELTWTNASYIADVRDRHPTLKPIWPFNDADLYLYEIEFHQNICPAGYSYNAQELIALDLIYDKDTLEGDDIKKAFEDNFGVESKIQSAQTKRAEKLKAEKKAAEDREAALMATESFNESQTNTDAK